MASLFADPKRRVSRANEHINDLETGIATFLMSQPYARLIETEASTGNKIHKIKLTQVFPDRLLDQAVEIAEGLRAALDKAGFASASALGNLRLKGTYFPIADTDSQIDTDIIGRGRCKDLHDDIISLFRTFNPYQAGNPLIWGVNQLANGTKHRILIPVGMSVGNAFMQSFYCRGLVVRMGLPPRWDTEKDEMELCVVGPAPIDTPQYNIRLQMFVAIRHIEGLQGGPAPNIFRAMSSEVERVVMATEAETVRILAERKV